jgi:hypothetical protein
MLATAGAVNSACKPESLAALTVLPAAVFSCKVSFLFRVARAAAAGLAGAAAAAAGPPARARQPGVGRLGVTSQPGLGLRLAASKAGCGSSPQLATAGQAPSRDSGRPRRRRLTGLALVFPQKTMALFCKHHTASYVSCELSLFKEILSIQISLKKYLGTFIAWSVDAVKNRMRPAM